jgi:hypothetical protein
MATIYITSDMYLDEVSYADGDAFTIQSGCTLTVRKTNSLTVGTVTISEGKFKIDSTATGAVSPIVFTGASSGYVVTAGALGTFIAVGQWYSLGTGTGASGQTLTHIHATPPPFVEVETGSGTGIYEIYLNLASNPFSWVGAGLFGRFFQYTESTSTITFGNDTNGKIPPLGANIRIPDILVTSGAAYNATYSSRPQVYNSGGSSYNLSKCSFSDRIYFNSSALGNVINLADVGGFGYFRIGGPAQSIAINGLYVSMDRAVSQVALTINSVVGDFQNIYCATSGGSYALGSGGYACITVDGGACYVLNRTTNSYSIYTTDLTDSFVMENYLLVGKMRSAGSNYLRFTNCFVSDACNGVIDTTLNLSFFYVQSLNKFIIDGLSIPTNGTCCRSSAIEIAGATQDAVIKNVDLGAYNNHAYFLTASTCKKLTVSSCQIGSPRLYIWNFTPTVENVNISNVYGLGTGTADSRIWGNNLKVNLGINYPTPNQYGTGSMDVCAFLTTDAGTAPTTGNIQFVPFPEKNKEYIEVVSGTPIFPLTGGLYLRTVGDQVILTHPEVFYAVKGFRNVAPTLNTTNLQYEYQIKEPSAAWGTTWKLVNATNLSAETVSPATGFNMRLRLTCLSTNANAIMYTASISVNIDSTYIFPTELSTLQINNMVSGSMVKVSKTSDETVLYTGSATNIEVEYAGEVRVVIRKGTGSPAYIQWDTIVTLVSGETTVITALQELDE